MKKKLREFRKVLAPRKLAHGFDLKNCIKITTQMLNDPDCLSVSNGSNGSNGSKLTQKQKFILKNYNGVSYILPGLEEHKLFHEANQHSYHTLEKVKVSTSEVQWALEILMDMSNIEIVNNRMKIVNK